MNPTTLNRRSFLQHTATLAAATASATPVSLLAAEPAPNRYPYLGRTGAYTDFQLIEPGLTITRIESWTQGNCGFVRVTTNDGNQGWGQLCSFEPDLTATILHRKVVEHALGSDPALIDDLNDRVIDANMKFPHSSHLAPITLFSLHFMAAIPNAGPFVEFSIEESANANESLYSPALKVVDGKVKIPDAPGWGFTPNPDWIAKASYLISERPASR